jgi:hypothetical protein
MVTTNELVVIIILGSSCNINNSNRAITATEDVVAAVAVRPVVDTLLGMPVGLTAAYSRRHRSSNKFSNFQHSSSSITIINGIGRTAMHR